jgi:uncharacterized cupin superfamily protein
MALQCNFDFSMSWFVVNARDVAWRHSDAFGSSCNFEDDVEFEEFGINLRVLAPGQPNCMYHGENQQEDFLVLAGECLLIVEGEERQLKQWDFVHCPPWTDHVFVGTGTGPCLLLAVGTRKPDEQILYPRNETALKHGAGVEKDTPVPEEAYARFARSVPGPYREGLPG